MEKVSNPEKKKIFSVFSDANKIPICLLATAFILLIVTIFFKDIFNLDWFAIVIFISSIVLLYKLKANIFLKYFFNVFYCIFMLAGVFLCNNSNMFLYELKKFSLYNGSFPIAVLYCLILLFSISVFDEIFSKKMKYKTISVDKIKKISNLIYYLLFALGIILFLSVFKYPSFKLGIDRFEYEKLYLSRFSGKIQTYYIYFIPLLLLPTILKKEDFTLKKFLKIFIVILPYLLSGIWTGNKFGLFLNVFILIFSPLIVYFSISKNKEYKNESIYISLDNDKKIRKLMLKCLILLAIILIMLLLPYYLLRGNDCYKSILNRTAQQGQLWWATYEIDKGNGMHLNELSDELIPIKNDYKGIEVGETYGIYKIMQLITPMDIYERKLDSGSRYSAQGIEIAYYYFKYIGIIIHALIRGFIDALLVNLLVKYLFSNRIIETVIISRLILISHSAFTQGDFYLLTSFKTIFTIILLIVIGIYFKKKYKNVG